jgi:acetyl/propionyl-CoA carboxylase alpha subunit
VGASEARPIHRLAILNRGEAAMRCVRSVKALRGSEGSQIECVALYTEVDRGAPFARHADRAFLLPSPNGALAAYLDRPGLLAALREIEADAVWPGWGFVAEDAEFADALESLGIRFLGPPGHVIRAVGDKIGAKELAENAGVPVVAWSRGAVADERCAAEVGAEIGYPLIVKASAGGGGRGIRVVREASELAEAFRSASAEAESAFGDGRLFIEEWVRAGRHIEVQIAADQHGGVVSLGCRDCSVQRRHQKVLLVPRSQPAAPGRARHHRGTARPRPRGDPDSDRARRTDAGDSRTRADLCHRGPGVR